MSLFHPAVSAYAALVSADGGSLTGNEKTALSLLRTELDSIWSKLHDVRIFSLGNTFAKRRAFKAEWGSAVLTLVGAPAENAQGYQFDGTAKYLRTGLTPSSVGSLDMLNSGWACWTQGATDMTANRPLGGAWSNSGTRRTGGRARTTNANEGANGLNTESGLAPITVSPNGPRSGLWAYSRSGGVCTYYRNGISAATSTPGANTADSKPIVEEWVGSINGGGSEYFHGTISAWLRYDGLSLAEIQLLQMAMDKFMFLVDAQRNLVDRGDSLSTAASGINNTLGATEAGALLQAAVYERGVGGDQIADIDGDLAAELASSFNDGWKVPYFSIGRNNVRVLETGFAATKFAAIQACIARLPSAVQAAVRVGEIPPQDATDEEPGDIFRTNIDSLNALLKAEHGHRFIEWYDAIRSNATLSNAADIADLDGGFTPGTLRGDTIHPNAAGSAILRAMFRASIVNGWRAAPTLPVNVYAPKAWIGGKTNSTAAVGDVVKTTPGGWSMAPTYAYQWKRGGVDIAGATSASYTTTAPDSGTSLTCVVTATNAVGSATATSNTITIS